MENNVSVRIGKEELKEIAKISQYRKSTKSAVLREVLSLGIKLKRLEVAIEKFQNNEATAAKAAHIAGISLSEFLEVLHERGINYHYGVDELREDVKRLAGYD
ncbi:MAG: UPF0175 family protein [Candidatus Pacearchaeota archaeon]|nr:UPF0175 family protein [Candidatus Pacearchaeota archaeon]